MSKKKSTTPKTEPFHKRWHLASRMVSLAVSVSLFLVGYFILTNSSEHYNVSDFTDIDSVRIDDISSGTLIKIPANTYYVIGKYTLHKRNKWSDTAYYFAIAYENDGNRVVLMVSPCSFHAELESFVNKDTVGFDLYLSSEYCSYDTTDVSKICSGAEFANSKISFKAFGIGSDNIKGDFNGLAKVLVLVMSLFATAIFVSGVLREQFDIFDL